MKFIKTFQHLAFITISSVVVVDFLNRVTWLVDFEDLQLAKKMRKKCIKGAIVLIDNIVEEYYHVISILQL